MFSSLGAVEALITLLGSPRKKQVKNLFTTRQRDDQNTPTYQQSPPHHQTTNSPQTVF